MRLVGLSAPCFRGAGGSGVTFRELIFNRQQNKMSDICRNGVCQSEATAPRVKRRLVQPAAAAAAGVEILKMAVDIGKVSNGDLWVYFWPGHAAGARSIDFAQTGSQRLRSPASLGVIYSRVTRCVYVRCVP